MSVRINDWRVKRAYRMAELHAAGRSFSEIGREYNLTGERVRQTCAEVELRADLLIDRLTELQDEHQEIHEDIREVIEALRADREETEARRMTRISRESA